jgi:hypothetical protein
VADAVRRKFVYESAKLGKHLTMGMRHAIGIVALIAAAQPVHAEDNAPACKTSDDISARCISALSASPYAQGYVAGLRDGMFLQLNGRTVDGVTYNVLTFALREKACIPINLAVGFEELVGPVRDYLHAQPTNQGTLPFAILLTKALSQTYPCPSPLGP